MAESIPQKQNWFKKRLIEPLLAFLKQGTSPAKLALAVTSGVLITCFPVFGSHSLLCLLVVFLFRLNAGAVFLVNNIAYPLMFLTYLPFIRMGEWLFTAPKMSFSITEIFQLFKADVFQAILTLWDATMHAIVAWFVVALPLGFLLYFVLKKVFSGINAAYLQKEGV